MAQFVQQAAEAVRAGFLVPHQGQLVLHQRVVDDVDVVGGRHAPIFGRIRTPCRRWRTAAAAGRRGGAAPARARPPRCRLRGRRPAAGVGVQVQRVAHRGAELVEQRDGERAPFDHQLVARAARVAGRRVARAGAARRCRAAGRRCGTRAGRSGLVDAAHLHAAPLEGLQQRVGEPLRQLVEGHPAVVRPSPRTAGAASSRPAARPRWRCRPARCPTGSRIATGCRGPSRRRWAARPARAAR